MCRNPCAYLAFCWVAFVACLLSATCTLVMVVALSHSDGRNVGATAESLLYSATAVCHTEKVAWGTFVQTCATGPVGATVSHAVRFANGGVLPDWYAYAMMGAAAGATYWN